MTELAFCDNIQICWALQNMYNVYEIGFVSRFQWT